MAGALLAEAPLRDAATLRPASDVALSVPLPYLVVAPFSGMLDAVALLGTRQHYALVSTVVLGVLTWRGLRLRRRPCRPLREVGVVCGLVPMAILGTYAICVLVPRPMVRLAILDPELVAVDFHSHTGFSWDGRRGFTVERNRDWHRAGGWNVAYVTDHSTTEGAELGTTANPARAGDDTILLPGVETRSNGVYFLVLGSDERVRPGEKMPNDPQGMVIQTMPVDLGRTAPRGGRLAPLVGVEISDGAPRGLDQEQRERAALLEMADRWNLAVVAGSNNHGWTYAPAAWSLLRIPGWRDLTPDQLRQGIRDRLRREGRRAVTVVERLGADVGPGMIGLAATAPAIAWHVLATLTPAERLSWLVWAWGLACAVRLARIGAKFRRTTEGPRPRHTQ